MAGAEGREYVVYLSLFCSAYNYQNTRQNTKTGKIIHPSLLTGKIIRYKIL